MLEGRRKRKLENRKKFQEENGPSLFSEFYY